MIQEKNIVVIYLNKIERFIKNLCNLSFYQRHFLNFQISPVKAFLKVFSHAHHNAII